MRTDYRSKSFNGTEQWNGIEYTIFFFISLKTFFNTQETFESNLKYLNDIFEGWFTARVRSGLMLV